MKESPREPSGAGTSKIILRQKKREIRRIKATGSVEKEGLSEILKTYKRWICHITNSVRPKTKRGGWRKVQAPEGIRLGGALLKKEDISIKEISHAKQHERPTSGPHLKPLDRKSFSQKEKGHLYKLDRKSYPICVGGGGGSVKGRKDIRGKETVREIQLGRSQHNGVIYKTAVRVTTDSRPISSRGSISEGGTRVLVEGWGEGGPMKKSS